MHHVFISPLITSIHFLFGLFLDFLLFSARSSSWLSRHYVHLSKPSRFPGYVRYICGVLCTCKLGTIKHVCGGSGGRETKVRCFRRVCIGFINSEKNKHITSDLRIIRVLKWISVCTLGVAATVCVVSIICLSIAPIFVIHHHRAGWGL